MSAASVRSSLHREPSLPEMLADPIIRAMMARDSVTKQDVEGLIAAARERFLRAQRENQNKPTPVPHGGARGDADRGSGS